MRQKESPDMINIDIIKEEIKGAEIRNKKYLTPKNTLQESVRDEGEYNRLLNHKEEILDKMHFINDILKNYQSEVWTPTGESPDIYMTKSYRFTERYDKNGDIIPPHYQAFVFFAWAEQIEDMVFTDRKKPIVKNDTIFEAKLNAAVGVIVYGNYKKANEILQLLDIEYPNNPEIHLLLSNVNLLIDDSETLLTDKSKAYQYMLSAKKLYHNNNDGKMKSVCNTLLITLFLNPDSRIKKEEYARSIKEITSSEDANPLKLIKQNIQFYKTPQNYNLPLNIIDDINKSFIGFDKIQKLLKSISKKYYLADRIKSGFWNIEAVIQYGNKSNKSDMENLKVSLFSLGGRLSILEYYEDSVKLIIESIKLDEYYYHGFTELGEIYRKCKLYEQAIELFSISEDIVSNHWDKCSQNVATNESELASIYYNLGLCYHYKKNYNGATSYIQKANNLTKDGFFSYLYDGFSSLSNVFLLIREEQNKFENIHKPKQKDFDAFSDTVHNHTLNTVKDINYAVNYQFFANLSEKGKEFFSTADYLFHILKSRNFDFAPVMVEYSKVVEVEIFERIYKPLEKWANKNNTRIKTGKSNSHTNRFDTITLGGLIHLVKLPVFKKFVKVSYNNSSQSFINSHLPNILNKITKLRNSSAHKNSSNLKKASELRKILIEENLLKKITELC